MTNCRTNIVPRGTQNSPAKSRAVKITYIFISQEH